MMLLQNTSHADNCETISNSVDCGLTGCRLQRFERNNIAIFTSAPQMEALRPSRMLATTYKTALHHIAEDNNQNVSVLRILNIIS